MIPRPILAGFILVALVAPAAAQQLESEPRPAGEPRPIGYLEGASVDFRTLLPPPPAPGDVDDRADQATALVDQDTEIGRYEAAAADAAYLYPRFAGAFGGPIDRKTTPALVAMLNRAIRDVATTTFAAKDAFQRPRPYQRLQLKRVCGEDKPPAPEPAPMGGSSYPSGHSAYGWATAMVLARAVPERAPVLLARAAEYGESRVVCGVHFPSDVEAGRVVAAAVVARLDADPAFQADLARARAEIDAMTSR